MPEEPEQDSDVIIAKVQGEAGNEKNVEMENRKIAPHNQLRVVDQVPNLLHPVHLLDLQQAAHVEDQVHRQPGLRQPPQGQVHQLHLLHHPQSLHLLHHPQSQIIISPNRLPQELSTSTRSLFDTEPLVVGPRGRNHGVRVASLSPKPRMVPQGAPAHPAPHPLHQGQPFARLSPHQLDLSQFTLLGKGKVLG